VLVLVCAHCSACVFANHANYLFVFSIFSRIHVTVIVYNGRYLAMNKRLFCFVKEEFSGY